MENGFAPHRKWNERTQTDALRFPAVDTALNFEFSSRLRGKTSGGMTSPALFRSSTFKELYFRSILAVSLSFFLSPFFLLFFFISLRANGSQRTEMFIRNRFFKEKRDSNQRSLMDVGLYFWIPCHFSGLNFPPRFEMDGFYHVFVAYETANFTRNCVKGFGI